MKRWELYLIVVGMIAGGVALCDRSAMSSWVGQTELEIEFVVTRDGTGEPVEGATIALTLDRDFWYSDERVLGARRESSLQTDRDGIASCVRPDSMCYGTESGLRCTNTYFVSLPPWHCQASAAGFEPSQPVNLVTEYYGRAKRIAPGKAKVVVPICLRKPGD